MDRGDNWLRGRDGKILLPGDKPGWTYDVIPWVAVAIAILILIRSC